MKGDDGAVFSSLAGLVESLRTDGRTVAYLSCHPGDDRHIMEIMKQSGSVEAEYVAGYADRDAGVELLARAEAVVAERLHAAVVGAACGTPAVLLEYRPKLRDFARSVEQEDYVVRTDEVSSDRLAGLLRDLLDEGVAARLGPAVSSYRARQSRLGVMLSGVLRD